MLSLLAKVESNASICNELTRSVRKVRLIARTQRWVVLQVPEFVL